MTPAIAPEVVERARAVALQARRRLVDVLEEQLAFEPDEYARILAAAHGLPFLRAQELAACSPVFDLVPFSEALHRGCIVLQSEAAELLVVTDDPFSLENHAWAEERLRQPFRWGLAHRSELSAFLSRHEHTLRALDGVRAESEPAKEKRTGIEELSLKAIGEETSDVVRVVRSTLRDALLSGASDVHLETSVRGLVIKFRIDGTLSQVKVIEDRAHAEHVIARIKVLAELDITERRVPQDGRFKALHRDHAIDFRVSVMPSIHGEDAVVRVLDKSALYEDTAQKLSLDSLGFEQEDIEVLRRLSQEPYGMLLVTGPTGSGKTTTLYAVLSGINTGQDKIITIEDPVEYQLAGVLQIPVNEKKGLTFAKGLRSILRHDPDKIMVGEIRDPETANIAVQSALTGHLVLTTVHANNVFDVIGRFMHMNVDLYSFVSALNGILAQRLVRVICASCAHDALPDSRLVRDSGLSPSDAASYRRRPGKGCAHCRGLGYRGRKAVAELLVLNDEIRELITNRAAGRQIKDAAKRNGTRSLREAALAAARKGATTLEEINRVTSVA